MQLRDVTATLQLETHQEVLSREWEVSQRSRPTGDLSFLRRDYLADICQTIGIPLAALESLESTAKSVAMNPALSALAWHFCHCLCNSSYPRTSIAEWPSLEHILPGASSGFYLLTVLAGIDSLRKKYRQRSIGGIEAQETLASVGRVAIAFHGRNNRWGLSLDNLRWLAIHLRCELFELGRLQFQIGTYRGPARAFRHRHRGTVIGLSEGGLSHRQDGQRNGAGGVKEGVGVWESVLEFKDEGVFGHPITPTGRALADKILLASTEWEQILAPGDKVLHLHIPATGKLDFRECAESFRRSSIFFPRHFPEFDFVAYTCNSWLLDPQLEGLLPPDSNLVRFLSEFYLYPILSAGQEGLRRVFGYVPEDPARAPQDTTLQREMREHLLKGGHWRGAGGFIMRRDLDWGKRVYRRQDLSWLVK